MLPISTSANPWSLSPTTLANLTNFIHTHKISTVVECGSGASTLSLAQLKAAGTLDQYVSLEHDLYWYHHTRTLLQTHSLQLDYLHHCPLVPRTFSHCNVQWYDTSELAPFPADLILIDGPPGDRRPLARYPALHLLQPFLQPGTWILLDDYHRPDEQDIVRLWQHELPVELVETIDERLAVLQVRAKPALSTTGLIDATPKVSIITTIYNREAFLPQAIESVLSQTYPNLEFILWDDGSSDDSLAIARYYATQDSRIRVVAADHQGRGPAVAQACALATGDYIGLVDSDDLLAQTALTETVSYLERHSAIGLVYTDYIVIATDNSIKGYGEHGKIPYDKERLLTEFIIFHFRLMRTSIYQQIGGFDPAFMYCQDYDLCLRVSEVTEIAQLNQPLYYYRHHTKSISCEKRIEQIFYSKQAIENALQRRGMAEEYELEFQVFARCTLYRKQADKAS